MQDRNGAATVQWLTDRLWWRETSYNAGPGISDAIRANGGRPRDEYCGHTQAGAQRSRRLPVPVGSGGSYNWFLDPRRTVVLGQVGSWDSIRVGYKVGIFSPARGRIGHITAAAELVRPIRQGRPAARGAWAATKARAPTRACTAAST